MNQDLNRRYGQAEEAVVVRSGESVLQANKVLRNTYALLSMTLLFSAAMAGVAMAINAPMLNPFIVLIGYFGLLFATTKTRNSAMGLLFVFALTGFMGFTLGPILELYMTALPNGSQIVMQALGGTGIIFLGLSAYALTTQKDFSFMGGFVMVGMLVMIVAVIANLFMQIPAVSLAISAGVVLLMSALILYQTSEIIHGGETNYIMATVTLYISIYNLFTSLLHLLGAMNDE